MIKKEGDKYILYSKSTGKRLGTHSSRAKAVAQEKRIQIEKARKAGHNIPQKGKKR